MSVSVAKRLPAVKTLYEILPKGADGGKEFARIVDLLIFHEARRAGRTAFLYSDVAGDYRGLDSFTNDVFRRAGTIGYQYKFYSSPLTAEHRSSIQESLGRAVKSNKELKLTKWVLVTPEDLVESSTRKDGGDVSWFEGLRSKQASRFQVEHWGHKKLIGLFLDTPPLCLFYYPELTDGGTARKRTIQDTTDRYRNALAALYRDIHFVGMSVYKQEATKGVPMQDIYIPLTVQPEGAHPLDAKAPRVNPVTLLSPGSRSVILGDPGSGKSTLLRFLALAGSSKPLQQRYRVKDDLRLPVLVTLRRYADELKSQLNLSLIDYVLQSTKADLSLNSADLDFFEYFLETGQALLLFDGLDELPTSGYKELIRDRICTLLSTYPGNTTVVTSRVVGYENPFRFDDKEFSHYRLSSLLLPEIE
jgi:NACHT domain